jgi:hypothetical protein
MALARYILGKFVGVIYHSFTLPLDVSTFAARCLQEENKRKIRDRGEGKMGMERRRQK